MNTITKEEYEAACAAKEAAQKVINQFLKERSERFDARWKKFLSGESTFTDDELIYSARARCEKCNAGLAYPKECAGSHQWTCSDCLKGNGTGSGHSALPFAFYEILSENQPSAYGATTRPEAKKESKSKSV